MIAADGIVGWKRFNNLVAALAYALVPLILALFGYPFIGIIGGAAIILATPPKRKEIATSPDIQGPKMTL